MFSSAYRSFVLAALALASLSSAERMEIVGNSGVSAQMMFLQSNGQVMILDKVQNNPVAIKDHPAWATVYNYETNLFTPIDIASNTLCAGGATLADGRWIVVGGNKAVGPGGVDAKPGAAPYKSTNGGKSIRLLKPCSGSDCIWAEKDTNQLARERWYATVEPIKDGRVMILGGMRDGGFVPSTRSNDPTYEFYPKVGNATYMDLLNRSVPLSLFPIAYALSDGRMFVHANKQAILWNLDTKKETKLPSSPIPVSYPANAGTALLPLRPSNNYRETILTCGGISLGSGANWGNEGGPKVMVSQAPAHKGCYRMDPLSKTPTWAADDSLTQARSMGQFVQLPTGELWFGSGTLTGVAGYSTNPKQVGQPVGQSFSDNPSMNPMIYNPDAPAGQRWRSAGRANVARLYHSSATLLPDSSILIGGSNPNADVSSQKWPTEYRLERWWPTFANAPRPSSAGLPLSFSYGGAAFTITAPSAAAAGKTKVVLVRTGFSTHAMSMGQRMIELRTLVSGNNVKVAQLPPNPALFPPGPALAFIVVDGIPSIGKFVIVGNGKVGPQPVAAETKLSKRDDQLEARDANKAEELARMLAGPPVQGGFATPEDFNATIAAEVVDQVEAFRNGTAANPLSSRSLHAHIRHKRQLVN